MKYKKLKKLIYKLFRDYQQFYPLLNNEEMTQNSNNRYLSPDF
jgi:hypothetical protein